MRVQVLRFCQAVGRRRGQADGLAADRSGSNAVEFSLVAPVLILILMAALHAGLYIGTAHALAQVAADTARFAMPGRTLAERRARAEAWFRRTADGYALIDASRLTLTVEEADRLMRVSVDYDMSNMPLPEIVASVLPLPARLRQVSAAAIP